MLLPFAYIVVKSTCTIIYLSQLLLSLSLSTYLAVQDSSISDIVCPLVCLCQLKIRAYNHYNHNNHYNHYRDSTLDLDLDWERLSELVTLWHSWLLLTNCKNWMTTLRSSNLQSDSDLDSIRNSCNDY